MNPYATHLDIMRECYYYTSLKLNEEGSKISKVERLKRKEKWLTYMEKQRMEANYGKRNKSKKKRG
jgi:hypothetical protein